MKLVTFSTDARILTEGSLLQDAYAQHFDSYIVYVGSRGGVPHKERKVGVHGRAKPWGLRTLFSNEFWHDIWNADVLSVQDPFETGVGGLFFSGLFRKPLYVQVHTDVFSERFKKAHALNRMRKFMAPMVLRRATRVRAVSNRIRESLIQRGVRAPITVLPIFVDIERFASIHHVPHHTFALSLVCIGRLEKEKQFEEAIRATALLRAKGLCAGLTIVGSGREQDLLKKMAKEAGIEKYVEFVGRVSDVMSYLAHASMLLVPSAYEGYGLVMVEALAAGVPVIAYDVGVAKEIGATIAPDGAFSETVLDWATKRCPRAILQNYPYSNQNAYVAAWVKDIQACI